MGSLQQHPKRLLLVDDNAPLAEATAEFLRDARLEVQIAETGAEALAATITFRPAIVLCDMYLPDMSGMEVARALRRNPNTKHIVIAMHTAMSDMDLMAFEGEVGADVDLFLSKPLNNEKLDRLLHALESPR